jgi:hypothetical protein
MKSTIHIIINGERLEFFPSKSGKRQGCPLSPLLLNTVVEAVARALFRKKK